MEQLQIGNMSLNTFIDYTATRINTESQLGKQIFTNNNMLKKIFKNVHIVNVIMK